MFYKGCQIVVVWRTSQWNLCKISLYRKWILSSERAKCVFSNFNKRTRYLGKLTTACFITHQGLSMSQIWAKSNFQLGPTVGRYFRKATLKALFPEVNLGERIFLVHSIYLNWNRVINFIQFLSCFCFRLFDHFGTVVFLCFLNFFSFLLSWAFFTIMV